MSFRMFRTIARFALVWFSLFPVPLDVLGGLRLVIVALLGLFFYLFCVYHGRTKGEGCGHVKSIKAPPPPPSNNLTDRSIPRRCFCCGLLYLSLFCYLPILWEVTALLAFCLWWFDCGAVSSFPLVSWNGR